MPACCCANMDSGSADQSGNGSNEPVLLGEGGQLPQALVRLEGPRTPIASLLEVLRSLRRVCLEEEEANQVLATLTRAAVEAHPALAPHLSAFGWEPSTQLWACRVDLPGVQGCLKKFKYVKMQQLGSGSYGVVYKAQDVETGEYLAIKKLARYDDSSTIREITTLRELNHPNIVRLRDIISTVGSSHVYLVLDCLDCDLRHYLNTCPHATSMSCIKSIIHQLLQGVAHIHANSMLHRDLKPQNILVDRHSGRIKITDFGLARTYLPPQKPYTEKVVTLYYRAPELLLGSPMYSRAVDLWSVGCIMAEMMLFKPLFQDNHEVGLIMRMFQTLGTPTELQWPGITQLMQEDFGGPLPCWPPRSLAETIPALHQDSEALDLLTSLLTYDPTQRVSATAALQHPWFWDVKLPMAAPAPSPCLLQPAPCWQKQAQDGMTASFVPGQEQQMTDACATHHFPLASHEDIAMC